MTYDDWKAREPQPWDDEDSDYCGECDNEGRVMLCPDDMCRGVGECIHDDGWMICPRCKGGSAW